MNDHGKSDTPVVPAKRPNNAGVPAAEAVEERGMTLLLQAGLSRRFPKLGHLSPRLTRSRHGGTPPRTPSLPRVLAGCAQ